MDDLIIDNDTIEAIKELASNIKEFLNKLGEIIGDLAEKVGEIIGEYIKNQNKPKYKPVKSLIKLYKPPFIKVRYRARANL